MVEIREHSIIHKLIDFRGAWHLHDPQELPTGHGEVMVPYFFIGEFGIWPGAFGHRAKSGR